MEGPVAAVYKYRDKVVRSDGRPFWWSYNWGTSIYESRLAYAIFSDDRAEYDLVRSRIPDMMEEMLDRATALPMESWTRDSAWHGPIGLAALVQICEMLYHQGDETFYNYKRPGDTVPLVCKAVEASMAIYNAIFATPPQPWPGISGTYPDPNAVPRRYRTSDPNYFLRNSSTGQMEPAEGDCPNPWSIPPMNAAMAYNHYVTRKGLAMPNLVTFWSTYPDKKWDLFHFHMGGTTLTHLVQ
jgi:hypothetical protein